jgi:hypothetical protein
MTSRQRLLAAYRQEPVDRLPLHVRGVRPWDEQWVATRDASYAPLIEAVAEQGDYVDSWGARGGIFLSAYEGCSGESWTEDRPDWVAHYRVTTTPGGDLRTCHLSSKRGLPGMQMEYAVKTLEDVEKVLSVPYVPWQPDCAGFHQMAAAMGERGLVQCGIHNAISWLHDLMGSERLALWSLDHRARLEEVLWIFHQRCLDLLDWLIEQKVGPVFAMNGEEYVTPPLHSAQDFRALVVAPEQQLAERIHDAGCLLHVHCHGPLGHVLEDFLTLGCDCLHPLEAPPLGDVPLVDAKRRIGHRICLEGNIQIGDLYAAPTEQIVAEVRHNREITGDQGYILCPTASPHTTVLTDQTIRNYLALIKAARE